MAEHSKIEWTDTTWQPITGCSVISPGCTNCYAMKLAGGRLRHLPSRQGLTQDTKAGPVWTGEVRFNEAWLTQPLRWQKPRRIFVCAHGDLFHESVPDEWIDRVFAVMAIATQHTFQVLTKRSDRMRSYMTAATALALPNGNATEARICWALKEAFPDAYRKSDIGGCHWWPPPNVWLGVSIEDQARADQRIPHLLATQAAIRFLSYEPSLGPVDLDEWLDDSRLGGDGAPCLDAPRRGIDWVIAGGESGPNARPMHPDWARSIRDQCVAAGVPFFFKQWGEWAPLASGIGHAGFIAKSTDARMLLGLSGRAMTEREAYRAADIDQPAQFWRVGKKAAGAILSGRTWRQFPGDPANA